MSRVPGRLAALRLLLLVLVAFGVAGMHTLGHPSDHHGATTVAASHETHALQAVIAPAAALAAGPESVGLGNSGAGLDPSEVCLAILTATGLAVLIASALRSVRAAGGGATLAAPVLAGVGRGPPPGPAHGLVLADLSVLRR